MKRNKRKILLCSLICLVLAIVFWYGGNAPGLRGWTSQSQTTDTVIKTEKNIEENILNPQKTSSSESDKKTEITDKPKKKQEVPVSPEEKVEERAVKDTDQKETKTLPEETSENSSFVETTIPDTKPDSTESFETIVETTDNVIKEDVSSNNLPTTEVINDCDEDVSENIPQVLTCRLSVRCDTVLQNMEWLDEEKIEFIPSNGIILSEREVVINEGESVFNILVREMKKNKIHLEFENTPVYKSAYIEGIANLYEFDCGELSGWMYKVNGIFPNYGCSQYTLKDGDVVEWIYTCDLGRDIGGGESARNGR